jgi:copper chaperone CopZ
MKKYNLRFILLALLFTTVTVQAQEIKKIEIITIKTQIYCDHCKACESCGGRFEREIPFIKGVKDYSFDEKAMTITITYNTKQTTPDKLKLAIAAMGFDADEVKADPKAVAKLDECCLKQ